jgi:hypothetical protein
MASYLQEVTTEHAVLPPRMLIHGKGGVGKTTLAADLLNPVFITAEEGMGTLSVPEFGKPETYNDVIGMIRDLITEEHQYKSLVIDTIDKIEPMVWQHVCEEDSGKQTHTHVEGFGFGKGYVFADQYWIKLLKGLDLLRRKGMTVCLLAHSEVKTISDPVLGPYDMTVPKLHKRAMALLVEWADIVGLLDIRRATVEKENKGSSKKVTTAVSIGGARFLTLDPGGSGEAKNRYDLPNPMDIPKVRPFAPLRAAITKSISGTTEVKEVA